MKGLLYLFFALTVSTSSAQQSVKIVGAMRNVMWKGQLHGTISLDTIANRKGLYGLGPVEGLRGELLIIDGKAYKSEAVSHEAMKIEETYNAKAPFFVYGNIYNWKKIPLPKDIITLENLEAFIKKNAGAGEPFAFKLKGRADVAFIHVVNLPEGAKVASPDEAHNGQVNYTVQGRNFEAVGFFSTKHQSVFTHHDTFMHLHLITEDRDMMGHLDAIEFTPGTITLYLPE